MPSSGKRIFPYVIFITDIRPRFFYLATSRNPYKELKMKCNTGNIDRAIRAILGLALIALAATGTVGAWGWIGVVLLLTAVFSFCPIYAVLGMSTCQTKK